MRKIPDGLWTVFDREMEAASVPLEQRQDYRKWLRYYLDFCGKYGHSIVRQESLPPFLAKLMSKNQSADRCSQACRTVGLYQGMVARKREEEPARGRPTDECPDDPALRARAGGKRQQRAPADALPDPIRHGGASWETQYAALEGAIRLRNLSPKTLDVYRMWVRKFQAFLRSKPPEDLDSGDAKGFLTDLAVRHPVSASSQNQAFNALLFFYRHVLGNEFGKLEGVVRAKRRPYIPVVLSRPEVETILASLEPPYRLVATLLYGCGLRLSECLGLRIHCFNLDAMVLTVHDGKGQKDRTVPLPAAALPAVRAQFDAVHRIHREDLAAGDAGVFLPGQLERKYRNAAREFIWQ